MSCNTCDKVKEIPKTPGLEFRLASSTRTVATKTGKQLRLDDTLIPRPYKPSGGWSVKFNINDQLVTVTGQSAKEVFSQARALFDLNGLQASDIDLWFNLNIQWTRNTFEKYLQVSLADLLQLAEFPPNGESGLHAIQRIPLTEWVEPVWKTLAIELSTDHYSHSVFSMRLETLKELFDPSKSTLLGDARCFVKLVLLLDEYKKNPAFDLEAARQFYHKLKVSINKTVGLDTPTYEQECKANHWSK